MLASTRCGHFLLPAEQKGHDMDGEQNGAQQTQDTQQQEQGRQQEAQQQAQQEMQGGEAGIDTAAYEAQLAERDARIEELEGQIAEASKNAETADALREEIAALKQQGESDRIDFELKLAGCRNVKAARAVLEDHGGDVGALKEAEQWLFAKHAENASGKTGLPNAGTATDEGKQMKRWREIAGLDDETDE